MRIFMQLLFSSVLERPGVPGTLCSAQRDGLVCFDGSTYGFVLRDGAGQGEPSIGYQGSVFRYALSEGGERIEYSSFKDGSCRVEDEFGKPLSECPEVSFLLARAISSRLLERLMKDDWIAGIARNFDGKQTALLLANVRTHEIRARPGVRLKDIVLVHDRVIGFSETSGELICLDLALETRWTFKAAFRPIPSGIRGPEVVGTTVVHCFGATRKTTSPGEVQFGRRLSDKIHYFDSKLYGIDLYSGEVLWEVMLPKSIGNFVCHGSRIYVASTDEIHVLDVANGATIGSVVTGLDESYNAGTTETSIFLDGGLIYFMHPFESCLLVYGADDLAPVKRIEIPDQYGVRKFLFKHEPSGKLYFRLGPTIISSNYVHWARMLEVTPNDLDAPIEVVEGPPVQIKLRLSEENPAETELWLSMEEVPLAETVFYGSMYLEDQAYYHGLQPGYIETIESTQGFNGRVHFRYRGSDRPDVEVREKLTEMEQEFAEFAAHSAFSTVDRVTPCSLDAQYIE